MKNRTGYGLNTWASWGLLILFLVSACILAQVVDLSAQEADTTGDAQGTTLQNRIDFGNAYIMGQSITSGSVYLLHRKKSDINSMLKVRTDFREEIIEDYSLENTRIISQEPDESS